jgi:hypothetical protein
MTMDKWRHYFVDASTSKGTLIAASRYGRQLRSFGSNLALSSPDVLLKAHEWVSETHLRPQVHSLAWIAAVATFGPLWLHTDSLLDSVVEMKSADELSERSATSSDSEDDSNEAEVVETRAAPKVDSNQLSDPMATAETDSDEAEVLETRAAPKVDSTNQLSDRRLILSTPRSSDLFVTSS